MKRMFVALCLLLSACVAADAPSATEAPFYAPDFSLASLEGGTVTLSEQRGTFVIINFWATWCGPCRDEMSDLQQLADDYADDLIMLGINQRESADTVRDFANALGVTFPLLLDPPDSVLIDYIVTGLPQTLLIDREGVVIYRQFGVIDMETFPDYLSGLISATR